MKRIFSILFLLVNFITGGKATGQAIDTIPQATANTTVFSGVSTPQTSGCLTNQGQNMYFLFYSAGGATGAPKGVQIRLEGSFNSDAATCTTGTWFAISDDGTDPAQNGTNLVLGIGTYPFIRANLVACGSCDSNDTISANFFGTSAAPGNPFGTYSPGQQVRKVLIESSNAGATAQFTPPYGSAAGFLIVQPNGGTFSTGTLTAVCNDVSGFSVSQTIPASGVGMPTPATPCMKASARCVSCAVTGSGTWNIWWIFYPPGAAMPASGQPATNKNSETTATNAVASVSLSPGVSQRAHVFSVSARCSAGSAQLSIVDTTSSTTLWSSGTAEVGTTTFRYQWNPGLAGAPGDTITPQLSACGSADVGTLDVQASIF